jgi:hypothetical protein
MYYYDCFHICKNLTEGEINQQSTTQKTGMLGLTKFINRIQSYKEQTGYLNRDTETVCKLEENS